MFMKIGIMQPYFFPYIGYFQLANAVDKFVIYDDIQYSKNGWIQRNRLLVNGQSSTFSISLKKDSDYLDIVEREISDNFDRAKLCRQIKGGYNKSAHFKEIYPIIERIVMHDDNNLFQYIKNSIDELFSIMDINANIIVSSELNISREYKSQDRVIQTCLALNGNEYINPPGGVALYENIEFERAGLKLKFLEPSIEAYKQSTESFVSHLSIIDVLMWNGIDKTQKMVQKYGFI
ncbi:WbqC family protein [Salmonella enterica]|nr:hypothetical protein [Salmonella enterica]ECJ2308382.1 WbqC family protein [Salmonella enterica subsp. arizonae]EEE2581911.1 WbqC family protein [Salmonella enterica subsp. arizonae serovar 56:z4,z23:-]EJU7780575.1 WbqC family protein [Salmonella enterica subsp. arizonae serovar 56:z36:-]EAX9063648.1 WbqC family protein [Salmonella enterica]